MADSETNEDDEVLQWHAATNAPWYVETIEDHAKRALAEALQRCASRGLPVAERDAASGAAQAWSEVVNWRVQYDAAYDDMKARQAAETASAEKEDENLVGAELKDQWYERNT